MFTVPQKSRYIYLLIQSIILISTAMPLSKVELLAKAQGELESHQYLTAIESSTELIDIDPSLWMAYFIRAEAHAFNMDFDNAMDDYSMTISLDPDITHRVLSLYHRANSKTVLGMGIETVCEDIGNMEIIRARYNGFDNLGERNKMIDICTLINYIDTSSIDYYLDELTNIGVMVATKGYIIESIPLFKEVIERDPSRDRAYNNLGLCYFDLDDKEKALEYLHRAIELNPDNDQALQTLWYHYYTIDLELSIEYARRAAQNGNKPMQEWLDSRGTAWQE